MSNNGMSPLPLSWQEIESWLRLTERDYLPLWEKGMIRQLSQAYVNEYLQATDPLRPAPYSRSLEELDREAIGNSIYAAMKRLMASQKQE
jgi:hypothetical protein